MPPGLRVLGLLPVPKNFCADRFCTLRRYHYLLPAAALQEPGEPPLSPADAEAGADGGRYERVLRRVKRVLQALTGRHRWHNFASGAVPHASAVDLTVRCNPPPAPQRAHGHTLSFLPSAATPSRGDARFAEPVPFRRRACFFLYACRSCEMRTPTGRCARAARRSSARPSPETRSSPARSPGARIAPCLSGRSSGRCRVGRRSRRRPLIRHTRARTRTRRAHRIVGVCVGVLRGHLPFDFLEHAVFSNELYDLPGARGSISPERTITAEREGWVFAAVGFGERVSDFQGGCFSGRRPARRGAALRDVPVRVPLRPVRDEQPRGHPPQEARTPPPLPPPAMPCRVSLLG